MEKYWLNEQVFLDLEDLRIEKVVNNRFAIANPFVERKRSFVEFSSDKLFARLVAGKRFITQGQVIEEGQKGAYIEIGKGVDINEYSASSHEKDFLKLESFAQYTLFNLVRGKALAKRITINPATKQVHADRVNAPKDNKCECVMSKIPPQPQVEVALQFGKPHIRIGENSWISGSVRGTETHCGYVQSGAKIGANTFVGNTCHIGKNVVIGDNVFIGYNSRIGDCAVIDHNVKISSANIGANTEIAIGTTIGMKTLSGAVALGATNNVGISPNFYNKYWWQKGINPKDFSAQNMKMKDVWARIVMEAYYRRLSTRVGANVQMDCGVWVEPGATIGNGAKLGYCAHVKAKGQVENEKIIEKN